MSAELDRLLISLLALPQETEWVEFKHNNDMPEEIGEYVSALANAAALHCKDRAYLVWGVENVTHRVLGTTFRPRLTKVGNEELENWLLRLLEPRSEFRIHEWQHAGADMVMLEIQPALHTPVRFKGEEWIRVGSYKKKLKDYPEKERALWSAFSRARFEEGIAAPSLSADDVLGVLDYPKYFEMVGQPLPTNKNAILDRLREDGLIVASGDVFDITNLGALTFAKRLDRFPSLSRKALRVVTYRGRNRIETIREYPRPGEPSRGYAAGFEELIAYISNQLPQNEVIEQAIRREVRMYPEKAIRELVPNAMIHQDFSMGGTGPMVEIFDDRLEISNPGLPLIETLRFIDHSPRSRNEHLADLMRRLGICEERGSGIDKVIFHIEAYQLPPPDFRTDTTHTRVVLFAHQDLGSMDKLDKVRACYQHCCLLYVSNQLMTNSTLRQRFQIAEVDYPVASRIIRDTIAAGLVKLEDPESRSKKHARYVPFWA
jgi:predicted HTH transcriptional regulator